MNIDQIINIAEHNAQNLMAHYEKIALYNQEKVLNAFHHQKIALRHFAGTTGYGYDDVGRESLAKVFAEVFGAERAIVSPYFSTGTQAIATALFGLLRPNDVLLSVSGMPYDTLQGAIEGKGIGSLADFGVGFQKVELCDGKFDYNAIDFALKSNPSLIFIQRSKGYNWRDAFSLAQIKEVCSFIKARSNAFILVDNCYGEFVDIKEPTQIGADIIAGSLIKNPGGGLAPTGGYIAGKVKLIEQIEGRFTAPGVGCEVGSYAQGYQYFFQGFFMAPHITLQALKSSILFGFAFEELGYEVLPHANDYCNDIIRSIKFNDRQKLIDFCKSIQLCSPVDGFVSPEPWDMPGYSDQVIMAAGAFVQGASIELSCDSPLRSPYIAYLQGGLTYEHAKIALKKCLERL